MSYEIHDLLKKDWPGQLVQIPDPPKSLRICGSLPPKNTKYLCVVGSRKNTSYGKEVCEWLISGLKGYPISIVSGLAFGIDSIAHHSALKNNLHTIAIPGSGLEEKVLYPKNHFQLAKEIINAGGALISEFEDNFSPTLWSFPQRNRIMAGISDAVLIIESIKKSGTLITSRLATEYNREVLAVPGNIFNETSQGPHMLLSLGAGIATCSEDILRTLNIEIDKKDETQILQKEDLSPDEKSIFQALREPLSKDNLIEKLNIPIHRINIAISILELKGLVKESGGFVYKI